MYAPRRSPRARKRLGQHFLTDPRVADRTLEHARLEPHDVVLEIGPGTGVLTRRLAARCASVIAVEKDRTLAQGLERLQLPNLRVVAADATHVPLPELGAFNKVVANLPYSVSTPLTFRLLPLDVGLLVLMYQREFAERLVARPGESSYGRLAAACAYWAHAEYLETVPRAAFRPPPKVASALVRLTPLRPPPFPVASPQAYERLLRLLFGTRRKTIRASLRREWKALELPSPGAAERVALELGVGDRRPEEVRPAEFGQLSQALAEAAEDG